MANKKSTAPSAPTEKPSKVPLASAKGTPKTPPPIEQADGSPKPAKTAGNGIPSAASSPSSIRTYKFPTTVWSAQSSVSPQRRRIELEYRVEGDLSATAPPIRDSKYLSREQSIAIYRWMLLNRRMEVALENLYKQGKVVGGVYFGLGQEGCSCASAYALGAGRLAGADDSQSGRDAGARLQRSRHHAAVYG